MKTKCALLAVHKTFEKTDGKREVTLYTSSGEEVSRIPQADIKAWVESLDRTTVRMTSVHAQDPMIADLIERGHRVVYTNWHDTGIEKNLPPQGIVVQFAALPASTFREFVPRPDLTELR